MIEVSENEGQLKISCQPFPKVISTFHEDVSFH